MLKKGFEPDSLEFLSSLKPKTVPAEALVEQSSVNVCTLSCTVKLVTSSQDNGSTVQRLFEETEEFRMLRVSCWMVTQQAAIIQGLTYLSTRGQQLNCRPR